MLDVQSHPTGSRYKIEKVFTFGLWAGSMPTRHTRGLEDLLHQMRRWSMNCLVHAPELADGPDGLDRLRCEIDLCRRYGVYTVPSAGDDVARLREAAEELKGHSHVLGWYIRDEPSPEFLPEFLLRAEMLREVAPGSPAVCLFYQPDSVAEFAPHQPVVLTDCYPFGYMHDGVSLGPHFAVTSGPLALSGGMERFNMWGARGILEWMDLCRVQSGNRPHWITLQMFESGDGRHVRWREPTAPEMRLQTYLAVAGGATGINYFHPMHSTDDYGNPRPSLHGEHTPLMDEIGRLGADLTPLGPLLVESEVAEPVTTVASLRPTPDPGTRVEVRRLRSTTRDVEYLVAFNNDVQVSSSAQINLSPSFLHGRRPYDLRNLCPVPTDDRPGALTCEIALEPGGGRILSVASEEEFGRDANTILAGRCSNAAGVVEIDYELAEVSGLDLSDAGSARTACRELAEAARYAEALTAIRRCARALRTAMRRDDAFRATKENLEHVQRALGRTAGASGEYQTRLGAAYVGLLGQFRQGKFAAIRSATEELRELAEQVTAAAEAKAPPQVDERALREVERVAERYRAAE